MKLKAQTVPYSSLVGGGLTLLDEHGAARFIVNFMGASTGITKEETAALSTQFKAWIDQYGCEVPDRAAVIPGRASSATDEE